MKKNVIWFDDDSMIMQNAISRVIKSLWAYSIKSEILIFDKKESKETENNKEKENIRQINQIILGEFINFMISKGETDDSSFNRDFWLVNKNPLVISPETGEYQNAESNVTVGLSNEINNEELYNKTMSCWYDFDLFFTPNKNDVTNESINPPKNNIKKQLENIKDFVGKLKLDPNKHIILIDMCLLKNDYLRLLSYTQNSQNVLPLFSMALYKFFYENKYNVFMYSSYICPTDLINTWNKYYKSFYGSNGLVDFYNRSGICVLDKSKNLVDIIRNISKGENNDN